MFLRFLRDTSNLKKNILGTETQIDLFHDNEFYSGDAETASDECQATITGNSRLKY